MLFELPQTARIAAALASYEAIYLSGVSLSLYGEAGRERLFAALARARARLPASSSTPTSARAAGRIGPSPKRPFAPCWGAPTW